MTRETLIDEPLGRSDEGHAPFRIPGFRAQHGGRDPPLCPVFFFEELFDSVGLCDSVGQRFTT